MSQTRDPERNTRLIAVLFLALGAMIAVVVNQGLFPADTVPSKPGDHPEASPVADSDPQLTSPPELARNEVPVQGTPELVDVAVAIPTGKVLGQVIDHDGLAVLGADDIQVSIWKGSSKGPTTSVNQFGRFNFEHVPEGSWQVRIVEDTLPSGYLAPHRQTEVNPLLSRQGYFATEVDVVSGREYEVKLTIALGAVVRGRLLAPGLEVEGAAVLMQSSENGMHGVGVRTVSGKDGSFEMTLYPGIYHPVFSLHGVTPTWIEDLQRPVVLNQRFEAGLTYDLPPYFFGQQGSASVSGRVLNQFGEPMPDLEVLCYLNEPALNGQLPYDMTNVIQRVRTNSSGSFVLEGLANVRVKLAFAPGGYFFRNEPAENQLAWYADQVALDLREVETTLEIGDSVVLVNQPFVYQGNVEGDGLDYSRMYVVVSPVVDAPAKRAVTELGIGDVDSPSAETVALMRADPRLSSLLVGPSQMGFNKKRNILSIAPNGSFNWSCQTPHPPVKITIASLDSGSEVSVFVEPAPNGVREGERLEYP